MSDLVVWIEQNVDLFVERSKESSKIKTIDVTRINPVSAYCGMNSSNVKRRLNAISINAMLLLRCSSANNV